MSQILPHEIQVAATDVGVLAFFSRLPILDTHGLNHPEISRLPKPEGQVNNWGNYRLDYLLSQDVPVVQLHFPGIRDWSFNQVIEDPERCDWHAERVSALATPFIMELNEDYLCLSIPSKLHQDHWLNMFLQKDRDDLLLSLPRGTEATDCVARFAEVCRPAD